MNNIKLPKNWNDVRVDQFILLKEMDETSPSIFYRYIEMLSIFTDTLPDDKLWEDMPIEELTKLINDLLWLRLEPSNQFKKEINKLNCIDIDKIKFGEFIDLEYYFKDDYIKNLPIICSILFKKTKLNEWSDLIFEPYEYDVIERSHQFETISITDVYGIISYYLEFKQKIQTSYTSIFEPIIDDDEEDYEYNEEELDEMKKEQEMSKWSWEIIINRLAQGDITKYDTILDMPLIFILNQIAFSKEIKQ